MILELALAAAAAASIATGVLAARRARRRAAAAALPAASSVDSLPLPVKLGEVVQIDETTCWSEAAIVIRRAGEVYAAILLPSRTAGEKAVVSFAPPHHHLYLVDRTELSLPSSPPARIEVAGALLDRQAMFAATTSTLGSGAPETSEHVTYAAYEGAIGDAAVVLIGPERALAWHGRRVDEGDYDVLGEAEPSIDP